MTTPAENLLRAIYCCDVCGGDSRTGPQHTPDCRLYREFTIIQGQRVCLIHMEEFQATDDEDLVDLDEGPCVRCEAT